MKKLLTTTGLLIGIILFLAVNIVGNVAFKAMRIDLTENQLYTLSTGSKQILQSLDEPITLRFYLSQKLATSLPSLNTYTIRVRELLEEYQRIAGGKLQLEVIDPEPFSEAEDRAVGYGLQGVPLDDSNTTFYFGLVGTNSVDDKEIITFFQPNREEFLEYDMTKLIYQLSHPKQKVVGIMSTLPIEGDKTAPFAQNATPPWMIIEQLRQSFDVRSVELDTTEIDPEINVLMLVHPKNLTEQTQYAIDQFVLKGGRLLVFVDPYAETEELPSDPNNPFANINMPRNSDLGPLFEKWGVEMIHGKVVGDMTLAQKVQIRKGNRMYVTDYPIYMNVNDKTFLNQEDIITTNLSNITLASAGALKKREGSDMTFEPLLQSSTNAMLIDTVKLGMLADPEAMVRDFKAEQQFTLAARISGKVKTAFPDGKPKAPVTDENKADDTTADDEVAKKAHLAESVDAVNIIVIGDTDMLQDQFWVQVQNFLGQRIALPQAANATLLTNAIDSLTGSNELISVRSRGSATRSFTKLEEIQKEAEQKFREKEKELQARLEETEKKITELQSQKQQGDNTIILSVEQQREIENFRQEKIKIRKELRNVQHELRKDIENLENRMKFLNIGLIPLLIGVGGFGLSFYRNRRKRNLGG
jgi:ABC-type uncharacterized transport system involved in gliding motility auxiliary subunit